MENKKVLGKIIPAVLVLVLALLLIITISSCSKGKKTPVGAIEDKKDYLKIDIADDKTYTVSKLEFYNKLRYVGYDVFEDALYEAALNDIVTEIKKDIEDNSADLTQAKYYKRFKYIIDKQVYQTADEEEIAEFEDDEKERNQKIYLNNLKQIGYAVDDTTNIYQKASLEFQVITLAKREYARSVLLKDIDDEDSENKVTTKKIEDFFDKKIQNRNDFSALLVLFSSQTEIEEALRQLNLKFIGSKLYRVFAKDAEYEDDSNRTFAEYEEYYKDFDTKEGVAALDDNEVLFELCRVYNYVYSYRTPLTFVIGGKDYLDSTEYPFDPLIDSYTEADYEVIKNYDINDMVTMLVAQDTGDLKTSPRLNYDYATIHEIDSTLQTAMYTKYLFDSEKVERYNTPSATFARGNYLAFKLIDADEITYKAVKALVELEDAVEANADEKSMNSYIAVIKEHFTDRLKGLGIYDDNDKVKAWALDYAKNIVAFGITGAKAILDSTSDRENQDSIWSKVFEDMLTDSYIEEKLKEYLDEDCKISIYDSLFEVQFDQNNDFYKAGNKKSKTDVLKVKANDKEVSITAEEMFKRIETKYGATVSASLLFNQILKEKYYDKITDTKKKEFEKEYEQILTVFAQGQSTQYGYNPSIGQKAFINLYFQADNKNDAIFNMWVAKELQNELIYNNPTVINENILNYFTTLTEIEMNNYVHLEYNILYVYTDDDENGEADDWSKVEDTDPRKQEVMELASELINIINERAMREYSNSDRAGAYNSLNSKYKASSRVSNIGHAGNGDPVPTDGFKTTAEQDAYYFAKYKAKGLFISEDVDVALKALTDLDDKDDNYVSQLQRIYNLMLSEYKSDLDTDVIIARQLEADDDYANLDTVSKDTVFTFEKGFGSFFVYKTTKANVFTFEEKDNADTSTGGKVYPYSIDVDDPFPVDEDNKPIDNTGTEKSLYNTNELVSINQLIVYIREYKDGVESLSKDVLNAFTDYYETDIMKTYTSDAFRYYIELTLIDQYIADGKITMDADLKEKLDTLVACNQASLFDYKENDFTNKWFELFK
ncbi:MAG: hypothetical protein K6E24_01240 [bacterium]|nr:hypothetical protein [bacterium]